MKTTPAVAALCVVWVAALCGCESEVSFGDDGAEALACGPREDVLCPVAGSTTGQPTRLNPTAVALGPGDALAYVALTGSEGEPGDAVAVVDVATGEVSGRIDVGPRPVGLAVHPSGAWLVVASSYARFLTVVDVAKGAAVARVPLTFYAEDLSFTPDGATLVVADRQHDGVWVVPFVGPGVGEARFVRVGNNPSQLDVCPDGRVALVTLMGEGRVAKVDLAGGTATYVDVSSPPNDVVCLGTTAVVATLGAGSGHPARGSPECDALQTRFGADNMLCDDTAAVRFADIQNDLVLLDVATLGVLARYTSDTAEQSRTDPVGATPPEKMRVGGAFPRRLALSSDAVWVTYAASGQVQRFSRDLAPGPIHEVGFAPDGVAVTASGMVVVANRLSEDVSLVDSRDGSQRRVPVGNVSPPFPATDEEVGELFFFSAWFSSDGDGSCSHCHPDATTDGKAWSVATVPIGATRQVPATRNLGATVPLLLEGTQDQNGFNLEMEDLAPRIDHDADPTGDFERGRVARDAAFRQTSQARFGREVGFDEMVTLVGMFLVHEPRLLPNPNPPDSPEALRGREIYESADVACAACHPVGAFTTNEAFAEVVATRAGDEPNTEIPESIALDFRAARRGVFDTPSLRGVWDRPSRFLHDGRARTIPETILTPGHPALRAGERGFNFGGGFSDSDHTPDTHGGVSHLRPEQVADLVVYLLTIE